MSHFTVVEIEVTDASCLIEPLQVLGYEEKMEVHERPVTLIGYDCRPRLLDEQEVRAEIVIRRHLWEGANDIGFARQPDGRNVAYIGEYDRRVCPTWHTDVIKEYGAAKAAKELRAQGWKIEITRYRARGRCPRNGRAVCEVASRTRPDIWYTIYIVEGGTLFCACPDFLHRRRQRGQECKHLRGLREAHGFGAVMPVADGAIPIPSSVSELSLPRFLIIDIPGGSS